MASDGGSLTCPHCGAPVDVRLKVTNSGWIEQPPIRDMARIRFSRSTCQISGTYVPVAEMGLHGDDWVYFSHHSLLHTDTGVRLGNLPMKGGWKRMRAGMPLIMMRAQGPGHIAFSADHAGETLALPLHPGQSDRRGRAPVPGRDRERQLRLVQVPRLVHHRERRRRGDALPGRPVRWIPSAATHGPGLLLLHGPGNTFIRDLAPHQQILVQPGGLIWKDRTVGMFLHFEYPRGAYWFSSAKWQAKTVWLLLQGPGRVAVQSVFERPEGTGTVRRDSGSSTRHW